MSPDLDAALCAAYPLIFKERFREPETSAISYGLECGDGWYSMIDVLCSALYAPYTRAEVHHQSARAREGKPVRAGGKVVTAADVADARREMLAARRRVPVCRQVKSKFGTLRFHVNRASDLERECIRFAERLSARVCERCGAPGRLREGPWIQTLCDLHQAVPEAKREASAEGQAGRSDSGLEGARDHGKADLVELTGLGKPSANDPV